jgi:hypothetical protein
MEEIEKDHGDDNHPGPDDEIGTVNREGEGEPDDGDEEEEPGEELREEIQKRRSHVREIPEVHFWRYYIALAIYIYRIEFSRRTGACSP